MKKRPSKRKNVALFGGTFDPPHLGHLWIAEAAKEHYNLDKVIFIPCRRSPHKLSKKLTSDIHRMAMLKGCLRGVPWAQVSDYEISGPSPSFSYRTAEYFQNLFADYQVYWIMGTDQWDVLHTWKEPKRFLKAVKCVVFPRPDAPKKKNNMEVLPLNLRIDISASEIRERIRKGKPVDWYLPSAVVRYVKRNFLYC